MSGTDLPQLVAHAVAAGVGRNISDSGMFVETREPFPLGSRVKVTFTSPSGGAEMTLEGEVRYQCFINFTRADAVRAGMRIIVRLAGPHGVFVELNPLVGNAAEEHCTHTSIASRQRLYP